MSSKNNPASEESILKSEVLNKFTSSKKEIKTKSNNIKKSSIDEVEQKWIMNDKIINLFVNNIKNDQILRNKYAVILIIMLGIMLLALITIFILVGFGILNYSDTTFNIFITGGIAEVFILVRVIVKYLFKDNLTNALNIILKHGNQTKNNNKYQNKFSSKNIEKNNERN